MTCLEKYGNLYIVKIVKKGESAMLKEEICKLREKLNKSIVENEDYETILKISVELDELIAQCYKSQAD